jgi:hypothetical protein
MERELTIIIPNNRIQAYLLSPNHKKLLLIHLLKTASKKEQEVKVKRIFRKKNVLMLLRQKILVTYRLEPHDQGMLGDEMPVF